MNKMKLNFAIWCARVAVFCCIINISLSCLEDPDECSVLKNTVYCDYIIGKQPIARLVAVVHAGVTIDQCMDQTMEFRWEFAVYCPESFFCGFGVDLERKYHSGLPNAAVYGPTDETCRVILTESDTSSCESLETKLHQSGITRGEN